ncbi:LPS-assembly lipoprotein LptE [Candidatus Thiosymbion oneisti]|uniref:LPS-assembly lipoprotein LptE n=1 Tax=Candidatus Thiosymbion oneisti TaxID=589554 RepID=UPI000B7D481D|nr:LPS assembly lipoprotein LptE [Candidatus Thiosymbion oneisti]
MRKSIPGLTHSLRSESAARGAFAMGLLLAALLATSACGFKLRGDVEVPSEFSPVFVQPQHRSPVGNEIVRQLHGSQVQLAAGPRQARMIIRLSNERRSSRVVAVDRGGKVLARELHYGLTFDAVTPDGKQLVPQQSLDLVRSYEDPNVEVLGKQSESELIYADMFSDAANRILTRLRVMLR